MSNRPSSCSTLLSCTLSTLSLSCCLLSLQWLTSSGTSRLATPREVQPPPWQPPPSRQPQCRLPICLLHSVNSLQHLPIPISDSPPTRSSFPHAVPLPESLSPPFPKPTALRRRRRRPRRRQYRPLFNAR